MGTDPNSVFMALEMERLIKKRHHKSCLDRYENEITILRRGSERVPPASFREIARILHKRHDLQVEPSTIYRFLKQRGYRFENKSKT